MTCFRLIRSALAVVFCLAASGCLPSGAGRSEEEREAHYLEGKRLVSGMDYRGAIEEFRKALENNPRSASAHFELALLYEQKDPNPAAAIYHFEEYLRLRPGAPNAETVRQHIFSCKQDLAKAVMLLPTGPGMQRELEQLAAENRRLQEEVAHWRAYAARLQASASSAPPGPVQNYTPPEPASHATAPAPPVASQPTPRAARTHTVQSGDTPFSISRKYGVPLSDFMEANPGLNPTRMQVGQTVNIPSS